MKLKLPHSTQNWLSIIGATIALISFFMIVFLFVISSIFASTNSYLGLVIYIALPAVMIIGLLLIPLGMYIKSRKDRKAHETGEQEGWPILNLNEPSQRNAFTIFIVGTSILLFASAIGSYEAFHFTESVEFCGKICHETMKPEFTAYSNSPHARVACVECHVGTGAGWYVKSKLSGLYQVYAVTLGTVPKPIETPITSLRPARETCEECHWPQKFYSRKIVTQKHYLADKRNTEWDITLIMKTGAQNSAFGLKEGIHWHINPNVKIEYKASDKKREVIPWVRYTNLETGKVSVYQSSDNDLTPGQLDSLETRVMDCMDCHNRPSHNYKPPAIFINDAMTSGRIPVELPEIKSAALEVVAEEYSSTDSAMTAISDHINKFYMNNYPLEYKSKKELIKKAIAGIQDAFSKNIFPEMKVRWDVYPNNIGHMEFIGCFRCHNDDHSTKNNKVIPKDCNLCHTISAQGPPDRMEVADVNSHLEFRHPGEEDDESWKEMLCVECHTGVNP